ERHAYALADLPTLVHIQGLRIRPLFRSDPALANPYTLYLLRRTPENPAARPFVTWAISTWRTQLTSQHLPDGTSPFIARTDHCGPQPAKKAAPAKQPTPAKK